MANIKKIREEQSKVKKIEEKKPEHTEVSKLENTVAAEEVREFMDTISRGSEFDTTLHQGEIPQRAQREPNQPQAQQQVSSPSETFRPYDPASAYAMRENVYNTTLEATNARLGNVRFTQLQPTQTLMQNQGFIQHEEFMRKRVGHGMGEKPSHESSLDDIQQERKKRYAWE